MFHFFLAAIMITAKKKMSILKNLPYLPAMVRSNNGVFYIEYYANNPKTNRLKRVNIRLERVRKRCNSMAEFRAIANSQAALITNKLAQGWNPWTGGGLSRDISVSDLFTKYIADKRKDLRPATINSYKSACSLFHSWIREYYPDVRVSEFTRLHAVEYLDYIYSGDMGARTWNNRMKMSRAIFSWAVDKCYIEVNPFAGIKTKRQKGKQRILIPHATRLLILDWCKENKPAMEFVCRLVFNSLIRPKEIQQIRVRDVDVDNRYIVISEDNAKNHNERLATITPEISEYLRGLHLERFPPNYYLFGSGWVPNKKHIALNSFIKCWIKIRADLDIPQEMQLYSLRDSGISEMIKSGVDPLTVMQHADHHDLSITTRYIKHADPKLIHIMYNNAIKF